MRALRRRLAELFRRSHLDRESAEEMTTHLEMFVAQQVARGVSEPEARRQARMELGTIESARDQVADERTGVTVEQLWRELTHSARVLRRSPGLTSVSVVTIGVGIGVSAILFALVNGIVLSPLRYPDSDRLVPIFDTNPTAGYE